MLLIRAQAAAGLRVAACDFGAFAFLGAGSGSKLRVRALASSPTRPLSTSGGRLSTPSGLWLMTLSRIQIARKHSKWQEGIRLHDRRRKGVCQ
jgi:hypothetical protein